MSPGVKRARVVGLVGLGVASVALVPSCSGDDCRPGILAITESAPSLTDRICGLVDGESLETAPTTTCELADCFAVCPTITPRDPDDVVTLTSCQHVIPGRPPAQPTGSGGGNATGGFAGVGGFVSDSGGGAPGGMGGASTEATGDTGGAAPMNAKPSFSCTYDIETLFCP